MNFQVIFENLSLTLEKLILNHNVNIGNTVYSNQYPWSNLLKLRELCLASCHIKEFPNFFDRSICDVSFLEIVQFPLYFGIDFVFVGT